MVLVAISKGLNPAIIRGVETRIAAEVVPLSGFLFSYIAGCNGFGIAV